MSGNVGDFVVISFAVIGHANRRAPTMRRIAKYQCRQEYFFQSRGTTGNSSEGSVGRFCEIAPSMPRRAAQEEAPVISRSLQCLQRFLYRRVNAFT